MCMPESIEAIIHIFLRIFTGFNRIYHFCIIYAISISINMNFYKYDKIAS